MNKITRNINTFDQKISDAVIFPLVDIWPSFSRGYNQSDDILCIIS